MGIRGSIHTGYQESMLGIMKWIKDNSPNKIIQLGTGSGVVTFLIQYLYDTNPNGKIKAFMIGGMIQVMGFIFLVWMILNFHIVINQKNYRT